MSRRLRNFWRNVRLICVCLAAFYVQSAMAADTEDKSPLSAFTDEQIAQEFQKRWVALTQTYDAEYAEEFMLPVIEADGQDDAVQIEAYRAFEAAYQGARDALKPFADIGFFPASAELGGLMTQYGSLETRCTGYEMVRTAALYSHPLYLFMFQTLFAPYTGIMEDRDLYYLLGREMVHRLPSVYEDTFLGLQQSYTAVEQADLDTRWLTWSVEDTPVKLAPECPTREDEND